MKTEDVSNRAQYALALNLWCGGNYQMRKTQMSAMLTALVIRLSGGLTFVRVVNKGKLERKAKPSGMKKT